MEPHEFAECLVGTEFELHPSQRAIYDALMSGKEVAVMGGRTDAKRQIHVACAAAAISAGLPVRFVAPTLEQGEDTRRRALELLDRLDEARER